MIGAGAIPFAANRHELPPFCYQLSEHGCLAFITIQAERADELQCRINQLSDHLKQSSCIGFSDFYLGLEGIRHSSTIKNSLISSVVGARIAGSMPVYQSYVAPVGSFEKLFGQLSEWLADVCQAGSVVSGSAVTGKLEFVVCPLLSAQQDREGFVQFQRQVEALIQSTGGTLAAQRGVGRLNSAALKTLSSEKMYSVLQQIKAVFDPEKRLNPGVILAAEELPMERYLKATPVVNDKIDACTSCGLCESVCVGRGVDFTARQKIAVYREIETRKALKQEVPKYWEDQFKALALDSCVTTGLCEQACPMAINTGELVIELRAIHNYRHQRLAWAYARHFAALSSWLRGSLRLIVSMQRLFGAERVEAFSRAIRRLSGNRTPLILTTTPGRSQPVYARNELINLSGENTVVYWPSCISQSFGKALGDDRENIPEVVQRVLKKAELNVVYPQPTRGLCCGQTLAKKGFETAADHMLEELLAALWDISSAGRYPVLADNSACSLRVKERALARGIHLYDSSEFIDKFLINRLRLEPEELKVAVHVTCSTRKLSAEASFYRVLNRLAPNWVEPSGIECCGYANEKGFMDPELSAQALKSLPNELKGCVYGVSNSRTCEIGLSRYSGITYYSLFELLDRHSEALSGALD